MVVVILYLIIAKVLREGSHFNSPACSANRLLKLHILSASATSHPYFKLLWTGKSLVPCVFFFMISSLPLIGYFVAAVTDDEK